MDMKMTMTMSQIEKLAFQIANDLKQIKTRRQNRYKVTMIKIEKLEANLTSHLKQIEKRRNERDDKICGVCYDCEATCRLDCVHKLCDRCYPMLNKCPFCRKDYKCSRHWHIKHNYEINLNLARRNLLNSYQSVIEEITYLENRLDNNANDQSVILGICGYINNMLGKHLYYRERTYNGMKYQRASSSELMFKCSIWSDFMYSRTSRIKQNEIIERLINIDNRIYNMFETYNQ